jgi:esterase
MRLNAIRHEGPAGVPLLIAHGLFGSARNWGAVAKRLSAGREVVAVDMRNHGASARDTDHSYAAQADDLAEAVEALGGRADVLGHSMGGKAAMVLALTRPEVVRRLVVADIAPVAYEHTQMGFVEAMRDLDLEGVTRRSEADRRLAGAVPDRGVRAFLLQSLVLGEGGARWALNLETLGAQMPAIMGFPAVEGRFEGPVLVLRGGDSDYVGDDRLAAFRGLFPDMRVETLEGAGHWLHAERPDAFAEVVATFLSHEGP